MAKTQPKRSEAKKPAARRKRPQPPAAPARPPRARISAEERQELGASIDRLSGIMSRGLEVVETGMTLSVRLLNQLSSTIQVQGGDGLEAPAPRPYPEPRPAAAPAPAHPREPERPAPAEAPAALNYIVNRQPLIPGGEVAVSFTINNDVAAAKALQLFVEGFTGERQGAALDGRTFVVDPPQKVIAPMDFDKFSLKGVIPPGTPPDIYVGEVVVIGEEGMRIPVRLIVMAPPG